MNNSSTALQDTLYSFNYTKLWNQISSKHLHTSFEILIQLNGNIKNTVNHCSQMLIPGNVVIMRPGDWHTIDVLPNQLHLHRDIYIQIEKMHKICDFLSPTLFDELLTPDTPAYFNISAQRIQILEKNLLLFTKKNLNISDCESLHTCILFELLSDYLARQIDHEATNYPSWLQNFLIYLNNPNNISLRISELAKYSGFSREHLCREFHKYIGQTLESYLTEIRINYSLSLLACPDFSIVYISNELGYDSQNSFTNNFRKQFGITPTTWRKIQKKT